MRINRRITGGAPDIVSPQPVTETVPVRSLEDYIAMFPLGAVLPFAHLVRNYVLPYGAGFGFEGFNVTVYPSHTTGTDRDSSDVKVTGVHVTFIVSPHGKTCKLYGDRRKWMHELIRFAIKLRSGA